jgi:hypothetical protein
MTVCNTLYPIHVVFIKPWTIFRLGSSSPPQLVLSIVLTVSKQRQHNKTQSFMFVYTFLREAGGRTP